RPGGPRPARTPPSGPTRWPSRSGGLPVERGGAGGTGKRVPRELRVPRGPVPDGRGQRTCSGTGRVQRARDPRARDRTRAPAEGTALALSAMANAYVPGLQGGVAGRARVSRVGGEDG